MEPIYTKTDNVYQLDLFYDDEAQDPRKQKNLGTMVCFHRRFLLGDVQAENTNLYTSWDGWLRGEVLSKKRSGVEFLPLYLYDHSGLAINTTGYSCPWDSGQLGWIYVTGSKLKRAGLTEAEAIDCLVEEVSHYDYYLKGLILCYELRQINNGSRGLLDIRSGFYGKAVKEQIKQALGKEHAHLISGWAF